MKIAVISDIHANFEAFREVLADIRKVRADSTICLGDNIGYGPEPEEVVNLIRENEIPCVLGNHELGIVRPEFLTWFNRLARESLAITAGLISDSTVRYLHTLGPKLVFHGGLFVHGRPPDSVTDYIIELGPGELKPLMERMDQQVCFVGHTHLLGIISLENGRVKRGDLREGVVRLKEGAKTIINTGAVGQPRDGNNNAKYVIWDTDESTIEVRFVPYDIARTAEKIISLGFPGFNASRLY